MAGLCNAWLDVTATDLSVGTSAGSTAVVQLAGATPTDLLAAILAAGSDRVRPGPTGSDRVRPGPTGSDRGRRHSGAPPSPRGEFWR
jgi:NTE family protein